MRWENLVQVVCTVLFSVFTESLKMVQITFIQASNNLKRLKLKKLLQVVAYQTYIVMIEENFMD